MDMDLKALKNIAGQPKMPKVQDNEPTPEMARAHEIYEQFVGADGKLKPDTDLDAARDAIRRLGEIYGKMWIDGASRSELKEVSGLWHHLNDLVDEASKPRSAPDQSAYSRQGVGLREIVSGTPRDRTDPAAEERALWKPSPEDKHA